eukprot:57174-Eustigmatos_ZCMA.PRE.2
MFQFPRFALSSLWIGEEVLWSCLIRRPPDQSSLPAPRSVSPVIASFIASEYQGCGGKRTRTADICRAKAALYQLSYTPSWAILDLNQGPHPYQGPIFGPNRPKNGYIPLLLKEVIQPHLPVRLPCYDFTSVTTFTFGISFLTVRITTSGTSSSHGVTGGVYKARERIHRCVADQRLLAIPASCRRVAACNLYLE